MTKQLSLLSLSLFFLACSNPAPSETQLTAVSYFDLKGYISKEASRLNKLKPIIDKTVMVNGVAEHKQIRITDWHKELAVFSDADINKSAWKGFFQLHKEKDAAVYSSAKDKVPVKSLRISFKAGKVSGIEVLISNANLLYSSSDTLAYFPDSIYQVKKKQHIKLLKEKNYRITGKFSK